MQGEQNTRNDNQTQNALSKTQNGSRITKKTKIITIHMNMRKTIKKIKIWLKRLSDSSRDLVVRIVKTERALQVKQNVRDMLKPFKSKSI